MPSAVLDRAVVVQPGVLILVCLAGLLVSGTGCDAPHKPERPDPKWTWEALGPQTEVYTLAVTDGVVFAGAIDGLYRSDDDGHSWQYMSGSWFPRNRLAVGGLESSPGGRTVCATSAGVYVSENRGRTWLLSSFVSMSGDTLGARDATISSTGVIFAGARDRVLRSIDGGVSWKQVFINSSNPLDFSLLHVAAVAPNSVFFATRFDWDFRSEDDGDTWQQISLLASSPAYVPPTLALVADRDSSIIACSPSGVFKSHDNGDTWSIALGGVFTTLAVGAQGVVYAGTLEGEIFESIDGGATWMLVGEGLEMEILSIAVSPSGAVFVAARSHNRINYRVFKGVYI